MVHPDAVFANSSTATHLTCTYTYILEARFILFCYHCSLPSNKPERRRDMIGCHYSPGVSTVLSTLIDLVPPSITDLSVCVDSSMNQGRPTKDPASTVESAEERSRWECVSVEVCCLSIWSCPVKRKNLTCVWLGLALRVWYWKSTLT
jgi:hypothetical protein